MSYFENLFYVNKVSTEIFGGEGAEKPSGKGWTKCSEEEFNTYKKLGYKDLSEKEEVVDSAKEKPAVKDTSFFNEEENSNSDPFAKLKFEPVDTGDFETVSMKEHGTSFTGKFVRFWKGEDEGGTDLFNGIEFSEYPSGKRKILGDNFKLVEFFTRLADKDGREYDKEKTVFRITRTDTKKADKGEIAIFEIQAARL